MSASPKRDLKRRPGYRSGTSELVSKEDVEKRAVTAIDDAADKAVFEVATVVAGKRCKKSLLHRRAERKQAILIEDNLYWFLVMEFAFVPRTADLLRQMKAKTKQFYAQHDMTALSLRQQYQLMVSTITRVMDVPQAEQLLRQQLKNPVENEEREKHQRLVKEGTAGRSFMGLLKSHTLPQGSK